MWQNSNAKQVAPNTDAVAGVGDSALRPWVRPRLVRVGTVAQVTEKVDLVGRNDGGTGSMKRT